MYARKTQMQKYYQANKASIRARHDLYRQTHRLQRLAYGKAYRETHREEIRAKSKKYHIDNRDRINTVWRLKNAQVRIEVLEHYGNKCACCGESTREFLAIDHIRGGGHRHLKTLKRATIYYWLKQNNYPDGFQILCHNCNCAKGFYGSCPHKKIGNAMLPNWEYAI
jgi:hypothetical protein